MKNLFHEHQTPKIGQCYRMGKFEKTVTTSRYQIDFDAYYFLVRFGSNYIVDLGYLITAFDERHLRHVAWFEYGSPCYLICSSHPRESNPYDRLATDEDVSNIRIANPKPKFFE